LHSVDTTTGLPYLMDHVSAKIHEVNTNTSDWKKKKWNVHCKKLRKWIQLFVFLRPKYYNIPGIESDIDDSKVRQNDQNLVKIEMRHKPLHSYNCQVLKSPTNLWWVPITWDMQESFASIQNPCEILETDHLLDNWNL
jgi:hypothetical protein